MGKAIESDDVRALFLAMSEDNEHAFMDVFRLYRERVFNVAMRMANSEFVAKDLSQNFFLHLWLNRQKLPAVSTPGAYIHTMISNLAIDHLKKIGNYDRHLKLCALNNIDPCKNEVEEQIEVRQLKEVLVKLVSGKLHHRKAEVFRMRFHDEMSYEDISGRLNISVGVAKNYYSAALSFIKDFIEQQNVKEGNFSTLLKSVSVLILIIHGLF